MSGPYAGRCVAQGVHGALMRRLDAQSLKDHVVARLAKYKVPRDVVYCEALPGNTIGKVKRNELRRRFLEPAEGLVQPDPRV